MIMRWCGSSNEPTYFCYLLSHQRAMENSWKKELNEEFGSHVDIFIVDNYTLTTSYFHLSF